MLCPIFLPSHLEIRGVEDVDQEAEEGSEVSVKAREGAEHRASFSAESAMQLDPQGMSSPATVLQTAPNGPEQMLKI